MRHLPKVLGAFFYSWRLLSLRAAALLLIVLMCSSGAPAYSVLTHEQIVDLLWTDEIRPLLLKRYPGLTEDQIREAHAYAYGGAVIQDLGYYPFGSRKFSDLVHYVRSGDFVQELLIQSQGVNEYAFALGALSHYASDISGHPAVNQAVAIQYPKLFAKFGKSVRFAQDKTAHLKTEFGFDTVQVAKNRYASQQYRDFIGFKVSKSLLERVFPVVYGMELKDALAHEDLAIGSFRYSASQLIPQMTNVALQTHKKSLMKETPNFDKKKFLYRLSRSEYEKEWGKDYYKPGIGTRILSTMLRFIPKVGPFKGMGFNSPTPKTEDLYIKSINATVDQYRTLLRSVGTGTVALANYDLDSGVPTKAAEYSLGDSTYAALVAQLADHDFKLTSPGLRTNILVFYSDLFASSDTKKDTVYRQGLLTELDRLRLATPGSVVADTPPASAPSVPITEAMPVVSPAIVVGFVGGFIKHDDSVHSEVQLAARLRKAYPLGVEVETFENYRRENARKAIRKFFDTDHDGSLNAGEKQSARVIIYGHSWGGSEAISLARALEADDIPVLLTIQVDSVAKRHRNDSIIPANVANAANFYQTTGRLHGQPEIRAADSTRTNIIGNFRFDYKAAPYTCDKYPWYDRIFTKAHTQIECDSKVWSQVESLIKSNLPQSQLQQSHNRDGD